MGQPTQIMNKVQKSIHELERQVGQLALSQHARLVDALTSDTENNTKQVMAVSLKNERQLIEALPK